MSAALSAMRGTGSLFSIASMAFGLMGAVSAQSQYKREAQSLREQASMEEMNARLDIASINSTLMKALANNQLAALAANLQSNTGTMAQIQQANIRQAEEAKYIRNYSKDYQIKQLLSMSVSKEKTGFLTLGRGLLDVYGFLSKAK